jgi:DNA-binding protein H-NS
MPKQNLASMPIDALIMLRDEVGAVLSRKVSDLKGQLAQLNGWGKSKISNGKADGRGKSLKGRKVAAKYRSRKDPKLTWAGRGATPVWMRDEMKAGKLKKDAFLIK